MLALIAAVSMFAQTQEQDPFREIQRLRRDIETLRSINNLKLSTDQMQKIVDLVEESQKARADARKDVEEDVGKLRDAMKKLRDALERGDKDTGELERAVGEIQRETGQVMRKNFESEKELSDGLKEVLNEKQQKAVARIGRHDPTRQLRQMLGRLLDRVREDDNQQLDERLADVIFRQVERMSKPLKLSEEAIDKEVERIVSILDEAIDASDEEFKKNRDKYLTRIFEEGQLAEAAKKMGRRGGPKPPEEKGPRDGKGPRRGPNPMDRRLAQIFSNPVVIRSLKKRLAKEE